MVTNNIHTISLKLEEPPTAYHKTMLTYALSAYGFLIPLRQSLTLAQWADEIEKHYNTIENTIAALRNREIVKIIRECIKDKGQ